MAVVQASDISEYKGSDDTRVRKLLKMTKKYGAAKLEAVTIQGYIKDLDDAMKEFQVCALFEPSFSSDWLNRYQWGSIQPLQLP